MGIGGIRDIVPKILNVLRLPRISTLVPRHNVLTLLKNFSEGSLVRINLQSTSPDLSVGAAASSCLTACDDSCIEESRRATVDG